MREQPVRMLSDRAFTYFLQLAETLNYTKTAHLLGISQPALTQHIKKLETKLQTDLFYTNGKQLRLTRAGEIMRAAIVDVYDVMSEAIKSIHDENLTTRGKISIGMSASIEDKVLTDFITAYFQQYPEVEVSLFTVSRHEVWELLDKNMLDIAILYLPAEILRKHRDYSSHRVFQDELLFLHHEESLRSLEKITFDIAAEFPWVTYPQNYFVAQVIQEAFENLNFTKPQSVAHFTKPEQMFRFSNETHTTTALPRSFFQAHRQEAALQALPFDPPILMDLSFVFRKDKLDVPRIKHFFEVFGQYVESESYISRLKNIHLKERL